RACGPAARAGAGAVRGATDPGRVRHRPYRRRAAGGVAVAGGAVRAGRRVRRALAVLRPSAAHGDALLLSWRPSGGSWRAAVVTDSRDRATHSGRSPTTGVLPWN